MSQQIVYTTNFGNGTSFPTGTTQVGAYWSVVDVEDVIPDSLGQYPNASGFSLLQLNVPEFEGGNYRFNFPVINCTGKYGISAQIAFNNILNDGGFIYFQYSIDNVSWFNVVTESGGLPITNAWEIRSNTLPACDNQPTVYFRINQSGGENTQIGFDDFIVYEESQGTPKMQIIII